MRVRGKDPSGVVKTKAWVSSLLTNVRNYRSGIRRGGGSRCNDIHRQYRQALADKVPTDHPQVLRSWWHIQQLLHMWIKLFLGMTDDRVEERKSNMIYNSSISKNQFQLCLWTQWLNCCTEKEGKLSKFRFGFKYSWKFCALYNCLFSSRVLQLLPGGTKNWEAYNGRGLCAGPAELSLAGFR